METSSPILMDISPYTTRVTTFQRDSIYHSFHHNDWEIEVIETIADEETEEKIAIRFVIPHDKCTIKCVHCF
jgi:hypothetical protein